MDYSTIRTTLQASSQQEAVTVNHRALITRTLTKYPVDYALFRELIQNSADAKAKSCVISFKSTVPGGLQKNRITDVGNITVDRLTVKNNGLYFQEDDWNRLREIAKGNPDENKIGAFGVGFYSVFELTDEPLVHSGTSVMSFYYDGDQLCYRKQTVPDSDGWTVIDLPYRSPQQLPVLSQFTAFLTLSFILLPLESIELVVDDITLLKLTKVVSPQIHLDLPKGLNYSSPDRTLTLKAWASESFTIKISYMNVTQVSETITNNSFLSFGYKAFSSFLPSSKDPSEMTEVSAHLRKVTGRLAVSVSSSFSRKMKETVLKAPPKEAIISMLTDNRDEKQLSMLKPPLSDYVFPKEFNDAKVFIGFPTKQSTAFKSHVAINQLIPTMERTAVDMANSYVKDWNKQILIMSGILSRAVYEYEFAQLSKKYPIQEDSKKISNFDSFVEDASYIMNRFEFNKSAPDVSVGQFIAYGFWRSSEKLSVPTQKGEILTSEKVRLADDENSSDLIEHIPLIPPKIAKMSKKFLDTAVELGVLKRTSAADIERELKHQTLTPERFQKLSRWCIAHINHSELSETELYRIIGAAIVSDPDDKDNLYPLRSVTNLQDPLVIPDDYPLPSTCIPSRIIGSLNTHELSQIFGWRPLSLVAWLIYATENRATITLEKNMFLTPEFAEKVLMRISSNFDNMDMQNANTVIRLLSDTDSIPTNLGMKRPSESYFQPIELFPDLPIKSPHLLVSKHFLLSLGVRESVDVAFVLKLLTDPDPQLKWNTVDVIKYLTANQSKFKSTDWLTLRTSSFFEADDGNLYRASQLYPPNDQLKALGMLCLKWQYWNESSPESKLILELGLKHNPTLQEILERANDPSGTNPKSEIAFNYFLKNFEGNDYSAKEAFKSAFQFVKCTLPNGEVVKRAPNQIFTDPASKLFGFPLLDSSLINHAYKMNISKHPDPSAMVNYLINNPPSTMKQGTEIFEFLSTVFGRISNSDRKKLRESRFIPVEVKKTGEKASRVEHMYPTMVYFTKPVSDSTQAQARFTNSGTGNSSESIDQKIFSQFFHFVDFSPNSRPFLSFVGVREEPTITEIARNIVNNPTQMYTLAASSSQYMALLLRVASHWDVISKDNALVSRMRSSKFLVGTVFVPDTSDKKDVKKQASESSLFLSEVNDDDSDRLRYKLASVAEIVIIDEVRFASLFRYDILVAPQVTALETLYRELGCRMLSQVVDVRRTLGKPMVSQNADAKKLASHIAERCELFLESTRDKKIRGAKRFLQALQVTPLTNIMIQWRIKFESLNLNNSPPITSTVSAHLNPTGPSLYIVAKNLDWFDVSQALVSSLTERATPDTAIVLESLLASDLRSLQRKGYNINRIIKRGEEERAAQLEAEEALAQELREQEELRASLREKEKEKAKRSMLIDEAAKNGAGTADIPKVQPPPVEPVGGGQGWDKVKEALDTNQKLQPSPPGPKALNPVDKQRLPLPENSPIQPQINQTPRGFFNKFVKNLTGKDLENNKSRKHSTTSPLPQQSSRDLSTGPQIQQQFQPPIPAGGKQGNPHVGSAERTASLLSSGFNKSRAYDDSKFQNTVQSTEEEEEAAQSLVEREEKRAASECDRSTAMNLQLAVTLRTQAGQGIKLYVANRTPEDELRMQEISGSAMWMKEADRFAHVLRAVNYIFTDDGGNSSVPWSAFHLFWDSGSVIAFNSGGALFFNLAFFVEGNALVSSRVPGASPWYPEAQLDYWFPVAAHELAHNFVAPHGVAHSHYTESYIQKYLPRYKEAARRLLNNHPE